LQTPAEKTKPARAQAADWVIRLDAAPADNALREEFERWLKEKATHRSEYQKVRHTWSGMGRIPKDFAVGGKPAGAVMQIPVMQVPVRKQRRVRWMAAGVALAAACLALVLFPVIQKHVKADYLTGTAELREVTLPDGSVAHLDAGSAIAVDYVENRRSVTLLAGQAYFSVVADAARTFVVTADEVSVEVTGTAFDVRKTRDKVSVSVESGTVEVATPGADQRDRLTIGESLVYDRTLRTASRGRIQATEVATWRVRKLIVYDSTVGDIVEELGRHMAGLIVVRDNALSRQVVSGIFDLSRPHEALEGLAVTQKASVTQITPLLVIVSGP